MQVGGTMDRAKPGRLDVFQPGTFNECMKYSFAELSSHDVTYHCEKDIKGSGKFQKVINKTFSDNYDEHGAECGTASNKKVIK